MGKINNRFGFTAVEGLLIVLILAVISFGGYYVWHAQRDKKPTASTTTQTNQATNSTKPAAKPAPAANPNAGYLVVNEWGLRFKAPSGLTDVQYKIFVHTSATDDELAIYAKPTGYNVNYVSNYDSNSSGNFPDHALGVLYRSTSATKQRPDSTVTGKKIGNYYYYTAWAFNGLATGAACVGLYDTSNDCQAEGVAFQLVNQGDTALLNTIEAAQ